MEEKGLLTHSILGETLRLRQDLGEGPRKAQCTYALAVIAHGPRRFIAANYIKISTEGETVLRSYANSS